MEVSIIRVLTQNVKKTIENDSLESTPSSSIHAVNHTFAFENDNELKSINVIPLYVHSIETTKPPVEEKRNRGRKVRLQKEICKTSKTHHILRETRKDSKGKVVGPTIDKITNIVEVDPPRVEERVMIRNGQEIDVDVPVYNSIQKSQLKLLHEEKGKKGRIEKQTWVNDVYVATRRHIHRIIIIQENGEESHTEKVENKYLPGNLVLSLENLDAIKNYEDTPLDKDEARPDDAKEVVDEQEQTSIEVEN